MKKIIITSAVIASILVACKSKKETASSAPSINCANKALSYNTDIKTIIESSCTRCHNANKKAGYNFFTIESVKKAALNGELLGTIKHQKGFPNMPKLAEKLDQISIDKIECWINNGMKE